MNVIVIHSVAWNIFLQVADLRDSTIFLKIHYLLNKTSHTYSMTQFKGTQLVINSCN